MKKSEIKKDRILSAISLMLLAIICITSHVFLKNYLAKEKKNDESTKAEVQAGTYRTVKSNQLDGIPFFEEPGGSVQAGLLPEGKCIYLKNSEKKNGKNWGEVNYGGLQGWIQMKYLRFISSDDLSLQRGTKIYMNSTDAEKGICLYADADPESAILAKNITYGQEFVIKNMKNGWGQVEWDKSDMWINLYFVGNYPCEDWMVESLSKAAQINLRNEPNEKSEVLDKVPEGTKLKITVFQNGWGQTVYNGKTGWVMLHYLSCI